MNRERPSLAAFVASAPVEAMRHPELEPVVTKHLERRLELLRGQIRRGQRAGLIPPDTDVDDAAHVVLAILGGFAGRAATDPPEAIQRYQHLFESLLA